MVLLDQHFLGGEWRLKHESGDSYEHYTYCDTSHLAQCLTILSLSRSTLIAHSGAELVFLLARLVFTVSICLYRYCSGPLADCAVEELNRSGLIHVTQQMQTIQQS
jgi:hypothetical protein